ncbi:MAG: class I SAM-dependent methyltransferase, partial [Caulobacteraceae bacterium]
MRRYKAPTSQNLHKHTVEGFGYEWDLYDQNGLPAEERSRRFNEYFSVFPLGSLPATAEGFDIGCGSGRWAELLAPHVKHLHCIDPSEKALTVARRRLRTIENVRLHLASVDCIPLAEASQDFGYALGVLHHCPDPQAAMESCVKKLKHGSPFLVYIYYKFENRPPWYSALWKATDLIRRFISVLPFNVRRVVCLTIALTVYWPISRLTKSLERAGVDVRDFPLSYYRDCSFYTLRTDALDRFGTRVESRFSKGEILKMMRR